VSIVQRVLVGLAVAVSVVAGSIMVRSPTGLEKDDKAGYEPTTAPQLPDEAAWLTLDEDDLVSRIVHDPVKVRGPSSFTPEGRVALNDLMRRTEDVVRATARSAKASGYLGTDERDAVELAVSEYAAELDRLSALR